MNIEEIDKWLDIEYGVSYTELEKIHDWLVDKIQAKDKEIERLNKGLEYMKLYWSNREEYEKNELLNQIRDKDTSKE